MSENWGPDGPMQDWSVGSKTSGGGATRYCPQCRTQVDPEIKPSEAETFTGDDASAIACPDCGIELGHAVWWPHEG